MRSDRTERHARGERELGCLPRRLLHGLTASVGEQLTRILDAERERAHADVVADRARSRIDDLARVRQSRSTTTTSFEAS